MNRRCGFSLIEVVVALSVSAALMTLLLTMVVRATGFWDRSSSRLAAEAQARLVLDQLEADLQSILWRHHADGGLIATVQPDQPAAGGHAGLARETWAAGEGGSAKPTSAAGSLQLVSPLEHYRFGQAGVWLRLITTRNSDGEPRSLPIAVAYQIVRHAPVDGAVPAYRLFRSRVTAVATFAAGYDLNGAGYYPPDDAPGSPGNLRRPPVLALLANGVIDFGVRLLVREADGSERLLFPRADSLEYRLESEGVAPDVAELFVRVLTAEGVRQLSRKEYPSDGYAPSESWWAIAEKYSIVSTRRVALPSRPL